MPPPRQDTFVDRVYRVCKILRYCGSKAVGSIVKVLCKTKVATFHTSSRTKYRFLAHRGEGISNYNLIKDESQPSPKPSPIGEGVKPTYSPILLFTYSLFKKCAFTLAEVLITLGIIGIVAAMTMPALIANHRIKVLHTQFLKAYSDLSNAAKLFETHEDMTVYDYSYTYDCGNSSCSGNIRPTKTFETFMNYFTNSRYATKLTSSTRWEELGYEPKNLNSQSVTIHPCDESGTMFETTGRIIQFDNAVTSLDIKTGPKVCIDINGKKGPNKYGYDWFVFTFTSTGNVIPYTGSALRYNSDVELKDKTEYCNKESSSAQYTCSYFALINQSPEDNSKKYWGDFIK